MPPSVAVKFVILLILLMLSALFSSAETSLTTVSKLRVRSLAEDGNKRARVLLNRQQRGKPVRFLPHYFRSTRAVWKPGRSDCDGYLDAFNPDLRRDHPKAPCHAAQREDGSDVRAAFYDIYQAADPGYLYRKQTFIRRYVYPSH